MSELIRIFSVLICAVLLYMNIKIIGIVLILLIITVIFIEYRRCVNACQIKFVISSRSKVQIIKGKGGISHVIANLLMN